jgi:hypothetical protein
VTTIPEKKREFVFIFGFMAAIAGLVAWRAVDAPIITGISAAIAVGLVAMIAWWYRKPTPFLSISPDEIWYGRLGDPGMSIERDATGRLQFREGFQESGWFLFLADDPEQTGILMTGFDMEQVAAACVAHGWSFA